MNNKNYIAKQLALLGLWAISIAFLFSNGSLLSEGAAVVYQDWYRALSTEKASCHNFEVLFCGVSLALSKLNVPADLFLQLWLAICYFAVGCALMTIAPSDGSGWGATVAWFVLFGLLSFFVYLQPSAIFQLTRQYAAGSFVLLAFYTSNSWIALSAMVFSVLLHGSAFAFLPLFAALKLFKKQPPIVYFIGIALLALVPIQMVLSSLFSLIDQVGFGLDIFYLKSAFYKRGDYSAAWESSFGYPQVSFRGALLVIVLYVLIPNFVDKFKNIILVFYAFVLMYLFAGNDLIFHRLYHYFREFMIIPAFLLFKWGADKVVFGLGRCLSAARGKENRGHN